MQATALVPRETYKQWPRDTNLLLQETTGDNMSQRNKSVAEEQVTSVLEAGEVPIYDRPLTADEEVLAALGYKPEFKREFSLWTTFCVSFAVLGLLPSFASTLYYVSPGGMDGLEEERAHHYLRAWVMRVHRV